MGNVNRGFLAGLAMGIIFSIVMANASHHETGADPGAAPGFKVSGHDYLPRGPNFRSGYVAGSLDAFLASTHMVGTGGQVFDFQTCMGHWTAHEMTTFVDRYLRENTGQRSHSAALVTHKALKAACQGQTSPAAEPAEPAEPESP